ncbi:MAG: AraC family transcriptional regulator [Treponema sp.]|jgi:AraC-like DNA-binding protein|nr:AraC family transcriptional regulator [Treponema sp.]
MDVLPFCEKEKLDRAFPFLARGTPRPNFWFPLHWHIQVEMLYILQGRLDVTVNGKTREGRQGDIVIVDTGLIHGFSNPGPGTDIWLYQFGLEIFSDALAEVQTGELSPVFRRKPLVTRRDDGLLHARLEQLLLDMFAEYRRKDEGFRLAIISKLYEVAVIFLREIPAEPCLPGEQLKRKNSHERLERIFSFIKRNLTNPNLSLEMAAENVCLNKYYFSHFLKERTGQSFYEHLSRARLQRAERSLIESETPVTEIAYNCGFNSITAFNRLFKAYTGATPSVYRAGRMSLSGREEGEGRIFPITAIFD